MSNEPCLHEHDGKCQGEPAPFMSDYGTPLILCDYHQLEYYERQDRIKAEYWDNSPEY